MKNFKNIFLSLLLVVSIQLSAQQTPANAQSETLTIVGATAHIGNGEVIENSVITFENGKITAIEKASAGNASGKIIDAKGKHVYPGFIVPNSTLGLGEIDAVKASVDQSEIGGMIPHVRSLIAYNAESKVVESMRPNGVLLAQITPKGGRISGTSSIVQLDAWNWEDAAIKVDDGIHLNWPNSFSSGRWWMGEDPGVKPNKDYSKQVDEIKQFLLGAKTYNLGNKSPKNLPFEATLGLFDGSKKLYIHANDARQIIDAITFTKDMDIKNVVLVGGYQADKTIDILKKHNIPVLIQRTQSLPDNNDDDYDLPYKLPKLLVDAGLLVGLEGTGRMERMNNRNLPFYAGQVVGQGLDKEKALQLITGNTAKILGIEKDYGTLEVGKSATLFISEGDALDMRTNQLTHAFIDGRMVSLETHQTELWKRYSDKYGK
ncbi:amidohydrolase family protein [Aureibaculum sp. 2210JD6-5]|uniref:amidohydrolase family protein n=1 Tax=Aureibaculum sp. 2210JD6-5 TaxID=3103957 RepID=UPI002AAE63E7|nr:amidohydrolase family protein [Aureibaculum sp. 2210JD6-5]MDY7394241.1 amidohydrolase family protein [Aureibaculum sp. 2210JD6-5]